MPTRQPADSMPAAVARRTFLSQGGLSLGAMALSSLLARSVPAATSEAGGAVSPLHHPPKIKRVIWLYMSGGPIAPGNVRLQAGAGQALGGQPMPESFTKGQPIAQLQGQSQLKILRPAVRVPKARPVGPGDQLRPAAHRGHRRRHLHHPLDGHRGDQPRPGPHVHEHGHDHQRPAEHGLVADLRPGQRGRRPARLRRADQLRRPQPAADQQRGCGTAAFCRGEFQGVKFNSTGVAGPIPRRDPPAFRSASSSGT